jgi:hypothetical protein
MKKVIPLFVVMLLVGCEERYRYACQDPANWENKECQRPACEVDGQCTDELIGKVAAEAKQASEPEVVPGE